jgi:hypothetical protein
MTCVGEMKGEGNQKPHPRFFPYIRALFLDKRVTMLAARLGALPERDLAWNDLPQAIRDELGQKRPWPFHALRDLAMEKHDRPQPATPAPETPKPSRVGEWWDRNIGWLSFPLAALWPFAVWIGPAYLWLRVEQWIRG